MSHFYQSPFPCWESQSTSIPRMRANTADPWTCCGGSSDPNLALLLCVLASSVHSYQNECGFSCGSSQWPLYVPWTQSRPGWSWGFNLHLVQLVGSFWVFFLTHTTPGFQLWCYSHLCMWVVHWGLLLRLPWRTWVHPCEGQVWRWCSRLGCRGSGHTRYSGELAARAAGNRVL